MKNWFFDLPEEIQDLIYNISKFVPQKLLDDINNLNYFISDNTSTRVFCEGTHPNNSIQWVEYKLMNNHIDVWADNRLRIFIYHWFYDNIEGYITVI